LKVRECAVCNLLAAIRRLENGEVMAKAKGEIRSWMGRAAVVAGVLGLACSSSKSNPGAATGGSSATGGSAGGSGGSTDDAATGPDDAAAEQGGAAGQGGAGPSDSSTSVDASADVGTGGGPSVVLDASRDVNHAGPVRIMAIGDSVTRAVCWRGLLWQKLNQNFASRFDLVGTLSNDPGCGLGTYDTDNQGYSSSLITEVVAGITNARVCDPNPCPSLDTFKTAFNTATPDVVLLHYGTNDVWNAKPASQIISAYSAMIDALREANPSVVVLLAEIIPMNVTAATCAGCSCAGCPTAIPALNAQIATFATTKSTDASPIIPVDQYTGFDATADTKDGVHPNTQGSQKMANNWYAALTANHLIP
jgi:lysophospholipase L1-like esterase